MHVRTTLLVRPPESPRNKRIKRTKPTTCGNANQASRTNCVISPDKALTSANTTGDPAVSSRPTPELKLPDVTCHPSCIRCSHPEGRGHCRHCVIACDHTRQPDKTRRRPVELCIIRIRAPGRLTIGRDGQAL